MNDMTEKKLSFDWRYALIILAVLYFVNISGSFLSTFLRFGIPEGNPTQGEGLTKAYTLVLPLHYLAFMTATTLTMVFISFSIEYKRAYSFRGEAAGKALLTEQLAASGVLIVSSLIAFIRSGSYNAPVEYLGGFLSFIFGSIDKYTEFEEIFFQRVMGGSVMRNSAAWIVPLCLIITFAIWNVALYYTRLYATKKGYAKRVAERADLYRENEAKRGSN